MRSSITRASNRGFTLIELLVVIAIIGILASIVVPNVSRYIARAQVAKAVSEITNANTAFTGMLSETGLSNFRDFFSKGTVKYLNNLGLNLGNPDAFREAQGFYNTLFYELLRQGRESEMARAYLKPEVRAKLGTSYMDIGQDPWGEQYRFWPGPERFTAFHRSYRVRTREGRDPLDADYIPYQWDPGHRQIEQNRVPGQPRADSGDEPIQGVFLYGYPAPQNEPMYISSLGANRTLDSFYWAQITYGALDFAFVGGGDDPNNWDNETGWQQAPR